ncbi:ZIP family metal transporter [Geoanaerobacter pelophilus]|uniref:ZIP family metal transporter n=1 Tax=Geoanaerobacter pelophilus TaxID=60036 RepID=UPI000A269C8F|nr:ZIP family zinc transporter [Geoanaerobacter pelophilus]
MGNSALAAGVWGLVGGCSLLIGAVIGLFVPTSKKVISAVMALGAGVLISSVAFELMDEAFRSGGFDAASIGLSLGAILFYVGDQIIEKKGGKHRKRSQGQQAGGSSTAILLGALMDGIPESIAIGVSLLKGGTVGVVMVVAVFLSNIPESLSSASGMQKAGHSRKFILLVWTAVVAISAASSLVGYLLLAGVSGNIIGGIQAFAAGAILTMLASTMMPEAFEEGGAIVGLITTAGFLVSFVLSKLQG